MIRTHCHRPATTNIAPTRQPCLGKRAAVGTWGRVQRHCARALDRGRQRSRHSAEQPLVLLPPRVRCRPHGAPRPARPRAGDGEYFYLGQNLSFFFTVLSPSAFATRATCFCFISFNFAFCLYSASVDHAAKMPLCYYIMFFPMPETFFLLSRSRVEYPQ